MGFNPQRCPENTDYSYKANLAFHRATSFKDGEDRLRQDLALSEVNRALNASISFSHIETTQILQNKFVHNDPPKSPGAKCETFMKKGKEKKCRKKKCCRKLEGCTWTGAKCVEKDTDVEEKTYAKLANKQCNKKSYIKEENDK